MVVSDGRISEAGTYEELLTNNGQFAEFLKTHLTKSDTLDITEGSCKLFHYPGKSIVKGSKKMRS